MKNLLFELFIFHCSYFPPFDKVRVIFLKKERKQEKFIRLHQFASSASNQETTKSIDDSGTMGTSTCIFDVCFISNTYFFVHHVVSGYIFFSFNCEGVN